MILYRVLAPQICLLPHDSIDHFRPGELVGRLPKSIQLLDICGNIRNALICVYKADIMYASSMFIWTYKSNFIQRLPQFDNQTWTNWMIICTLWKCSQKAIFASLTVASRNRCEVQRHREDQHRWNRQSLKSTNRVQLFVDHIHLVRSQRFRLDTICCHS